MGEQGSAARDIIKAAQATTGTRRAGAEGRRASRRRRRRRSRRRRTRCGAAPARPRAGAERAGDRAAIRSRRPPRSWRGWSASVNRAIGEQATAASTQIATSMSSMRRESEQAARALKEQTRAVKEMSTANANTARHIKLITAANKEHSVAASGVLGQLREVRAITDRNARDVKETRGGTAELLEHARELAGLARSGNGKRGATAAAAGNGRAGAAADPQRRPTAARQGERTRMTDRHADAPDGESPPEPRIGILTTDTALVVTSWDADLVRDDRHRGGRRVGRPLTDVVPDLQTRHLLDAIARAARDGRGAGAGPGAPPVPDPLSAAARCRRFDHMRQRVVDRAASRRAAHGRPRDHGGGRHRAASSASRRSRASCSRPIRPRGCARSTRSSAHDPIEGARTAAAGARRRGLARPAHRRPRRRVAARSARSSTPLVAALREQHRNFSVLSSALQLLSMTGIDLTFALDRTAAAGRFRSADPGGAGARHAAAIRAPSTR